jgi:hypothetical protein
LGTLKTTDYRTRRIRWTGIVAPGMGADRPDHPDHADHSLANGFGHQPP